MPELNAAKITIVDWFKGKGVEIGGNVYFYPHGREIIEALVLQELGIELSDT